MSTRIQLVGSVLRGKLLISFDTRENSETRVLRQFLVPRNKVIYRAPSYGYFSDVIGPAGAPWRSSSPFGGATRGKEQQGGCNRDQCCPSQAAFLLLAFICYLRLPPVGFFPHTFPLVGTPVSHCCTTRGHQLI